MNNYRVIFDAAIKSLIRDRLLQLLVVVAFCMLLVVPVLSMFSMRQVQELSITLSLSAITMILLVMTVILGSSSVWRDFDRRYLISILGLPVSRTCYLLGRFAAIVAFIMTICVVLGFVSVVIISLVASQYPSEIHIKWLNIVISILFDGIKFVLVAAVAMMFSAISSSFYFPFIATLVIYFCGSASQEVYEYVSSGMGKNLSLTSRTVINTVYYLIPNFSAFDFKVQAVYALPISLQGILLTTSYFVLYCSLIIMVSLWVFNRRELI